MQQLQTFEQSATFDPTNPNQIVYERYTAIPGGYGSFYFNRVPTQTQRLNGLRGTMSIPVWLQALLVAGLAAGASYGGVRLYRHYRA